MNPIYCGVSDQFAGHGAGHEPHPSCQSPVQRKETMTERLAFWRTLYRLGDETVEQRGVAIVVWAVYVLTGRQETVVELVQ